MDKILVFIPMYNCEKQITRVLDQLDETMCKILSGVIIVNNISTDEGESRAAQHLEANKYDIPIKILRNNQNYNLGGSHKVAFHYAIENHYDYVIVLHGDDQANLHDFYSLLQSREYEKYDCCLGTRFMRGAQLSGYSRFRTFGNYVYNIIFSICTGRIVKDMGSGLNMYRVSSLKTDFFRAYHDGLLFNHYMLLANAFFKFKVLYYPITWREEDQVSNLKMKQALRTIKVAVSYLFSNKKKFMEQEFRDVKIEEYSYQEIYAKETVE